MAAKGLKLPIFRIATATVAFNPLPVKFFAPLLSIIFLRVELLADFAHCLVKKTVPTTERLANELWSSFHHPRKVARCLVLFWLCKYHPSCVSRQSFLLVLEELFRR